jgi:hypothetical protein
MIAWIMTKLHHVPTRGSQEAKMVFHIMLRRLTQGPAQDAQALLRLCSGSAQAGSASIPEASISYRYRIVLVSIARIDIESI